MAEAEEKTIDRLGLLSDALSQTVAILRTLDEGERAKLIRTVSTLFDLSPVSEVSRGAVTTASHSESSNRFSRESTLTPKEFLLKKQPRSDVERVACLGYYLAHYREQPNFKTIDISTLNTEAAQTKFSNTAQAVGNATQYGYLAPSIKGTKQLSAAGEMYVEALPDREAATAALMHARPKRSSKKKKVT
jgi:hypothetical protein